jgi:hypothetical protein
LQETYQSCFCLTEDFQTSLSCPQLQFWMQKVEMYSWTVSIRYLYYSWSSERTNWLFSFGITRNA